MKELDGRFEVALALAKEGGRLASAMRATLGRVEAKSPIDFCTEADLAVERLVRETLTSRFGDTVIGEEYGGDASDSVWLVDPIDGTAGYIHGNGRWCVSIAYVREGLIELAALYAPDRSRLYSARRGGGAFLNGKPIHVSHLGHGAAPVVEAGWSDRRPLAAYCDALRDLTAAGCEFRRHGSGALALAEVAEGISDGYIELHINAWDTLAGLLLVSEAGGRTNDFLAGGGLVRGNGLYACTPEIEPALRRIMTPHVNAPESVAVGEKGTGALEYRQDIEARLTALRG